MLNIFVGFEQTNKYVICRCQMHYSLAQLVTDGHSKRRWRDVRVYR